MDEIDYERLKARLTESFDSRYRKIVDCDDIKEETQEDVKSLRIDLTKGITKLDILIGILGTLAVPVIAVCVKNLFGV